MDGRILTTYGGGITHVVLKLGLQMTRRSCTEGESPTSETRDVFSVRNVEADVSQGILSVGKRRNASASSRG